LASAWEGLLDILVNNAGVMMTPEQHTRQGWELQFATAHRLWDVSDPLLQHA
jgi:NAD(P)-dependent dehydrogenase (short-subunit alcohol dehydrogenase family)